MNVNNQVLLIPHDFEAEQAVIGSLISNNSLFSEVHEILGVNSFHAENHRHIFKAISSLLLENSPVDEILLGDRLKDTGKLEEIGGYAYLAELVESVPSTGNIVYYAKVIKQHETVRKIISFSSDVTRMSRDPTIGIDSIISYAEEKINEINGVRSDKKTRRIKEVLYDVFKDTERNSLNKSDIIGLQTGFIDLDKMTSGLIAPDLITIAAASGIGKTAFALNIVENIYYRSKEKRATLVFSREMSDKQLASRMLCSNGKIDTRKLRSGNLDQNDYDRLAMATDNLSDKNIYFNDEISHTDQVMMECKRFHKKNELCLVVIDYLQLLESVSKQNREQEIATISRNNKNLAKQLNIPVIQLSQINRNFALRKDKRPQLSDLRESAAIEHDSDIIWLLYRDEHYNPETDKKGMAEVNTAKHRNGPTGVTELGYVGKYTKFTNLGKNEY